jgi:hypothetical protein
MVLTLKWSNGGIPLPGFRPSYWIYHEYLTEHFATGTLKNLVAKDDMLTFPDDYDCCWGPAVLGDTREVDAEHGIPRYTERIWCIWKAAVGKYYLAKSNASFDDWETIEEFVYIPSGSEAININFDSTGYYVVAFQLYPAGASERQLWIYQYPYSGDAIKKVVEGDQYEKPFVFLDHEKTLHYFYLDNSDPGNTVVKYRVDSDDFGTVYELPISVTGVKDHFVIRFYTTEKYGKFDFLLYVLVAFKMSGMVYYLLTDILMENPVIVIPDITGGTCEDEYGWQTELQGIAWAMVSSPNQAVDDVGRFGTPLQTIVWQEMRFEKQYPADTGCLYTCLQNIRWGEMIFEKRSQAETNGVSAGLRSILWLEITS